MKFDERNPSQPNPDRYSEFERLLKSGREEFPARLARVEEGLFDRIRDAQGLGRLADLKREEIPAPGFWDRVEEKLTARIIRHQEYDEPVDRCIGESVPESSVSWDGLEAKLERRIGSAHRLENWELQLKAEAILLPGQWENLEEKITARIDASRPGLVPASGVSEYSWLGLGLLWLRRPPVLVPLLLALAAVGGLGFYVQQQRRPILTMVYEVQGDAAAFRADRNTVSHVMPGSTVRTQPDESIVLVNQRGRVELQNGSRVDFRRAQAHKIEYHVGFANEGKDVGGKVTFFVKHQKGKESFTVYTDDYQVEVTGTYFQIYPALDGRPTTMVMEGKVVIRSPAQDDLVVSAGQSLVYDLFSKRYRVLGGGPVVSRQDIESVPSVEELQGYEMFTVTSNVPLAEVRIDGKFHGFTPLVILQPLGTHSIQMGKEGFTTLDTVVTVAKNGSNVLNALFASLPAPRTNLSENRPPHGLSTKLARKPRNSVVNSTPIADSIAHSEGVGELYFRRAEDVQNQNWQLAFQLYQKSLDYPVSSFRRETALFSIARLRADHETDKSQAKAAFLKYLALYPHGAFAGESWLRMAELEFAENPGKSIDYYLEYFKQYPHNQRISELEHRVGLIYLQEKQYDKAIAMLQESISNVPYGTEDEKRPIYASLQRAFLAKGDKENATFVEKQYLHGDSRSDR